MHFDLHDPTFWVMIAFFGFIGLLYYYKVHKVVGKALDGRADAIRKELDEARRLRDEAQALLADYKRKSLEAETLTAQTRKALQETVERRTKSAEEKIARAEAQALAEVRSSAVDSAIAAAEKILKARASSAATAAQLVEQGIKDLAGKLN